MSLLQDALRAAHAPPPRRPPSAARVLVAGGGGALGSALLEALLGARRHAQVSVLVTQPLHAALGGLSTVVWGEHAPETPLPATAVIVFDRERGANGREEAFYKPQPVQLPALAAQLHARGVRHLLVVMPHTQATLPEALKRGLASLDEHAVARLGFEHLVVMRSAQVPPHLRHPHPAQRLAHWMLSQLQMMVPQRERPVRALKVAQFAARLAACLPLASPGTRVVPPEVVWDAAQARDAGAAAEAWLNAPSPPATPPPPSPP
ncbi:MAG: hypothetical protein KF891_16400 [Rhizobacter sp.]|nr:hypothetical protein [Rhizobacter sp.]